VSQLRSKLPDIPGHGSGVMESGPHIQFATLTAHQIRDSQSGLSAPGKI